MNAQDTHLGYILATNLAQAFEGGVYFAKVSDVRSGLRQYGFKPDEVDVVISRLSLYQGWVVDGDMIIIDITR